jgi:hypothetical protein
MVTAFARNPSKQKIKHPSLEIIEGDESDSVLVDRADVAEFVLAQLAENSYVHKTPGVSY